MACKMVGIFGTLVFENWEGAERGILNNFQFLFNESLDT